MSQLDLFAKPTQAQVLRDEGMALVAANEARSWKDRHDIELRAFVREMGQRAFMSEDFRLWFLQRGHPEPHDPNVWGSLWHAAAMRGEIVKTGRWRRMTHAKSHARANAEWKAPYV